MKLLKPPGYLIRARKVTQPNLRLICFHHAGGSSASFWNWKELLPRDWDLCLFEQPGRGRLFSKPLETDIRRIVDLFLLDLFHLIDGVPMVFFGHSMGARVAFELTHRMQQEGLSLPSLLCVSAASAPRSGCRKVGYSKLSRDDCLVLLKEMGGTPPEVFLEPELRDIVLNVLRADFEVCDSWEPEMGRVVLHAPILALGGFSDPYVSSDSLADWKSETSERFDLVLLPGAHFYFRDKEADLFAAIDAGFRQTAPL